MVVLARDLPAGASLTSSDVRLETWDPAIGPKQALRSVSAVLGHALSSAGAAGEPVTSSRLVGSSILSRLPRGTLAVHLPLDDAGLSTYLRAGDRVDVISRMTGAVQANGVVLLGIDPTPAADGWAPSAAVTSGTGVVIAVTSAQAARLARTSSGESPGTGSMLALHAVR